MTQPAFNFDTGNVPYAKGSHTSCKAARDLAQSGTRGAKTWKYLQALAAAPDGLTDAHAAAIVGVPLSSVCSIRNGAMQNIPQLVERGEETMGQFGKSVYRWTLTSAGITLIRGAA